MTAEEANDLRNDLLAQQAQEAEDARKYTAICEDLDNFTDYYEDILGEFADKWREVKDLLDQHGYYDIKPEEII